MDRVCKIASILLQSDKPETVISLAEKLQVSEKTVRNDLKKLQEFIEDLNLKVSKRPGIGTTIEGEELNKIKLQQKIKNRIKYIEPYSPEDRINYILKRLFMNKSNITIQEIADELYVSRVTVHKDLKEVEKWLNKFELKLLRKTNYGIKIIGDERNWREAIASLISISKQYEELKELLYKDYNGRIDYKSLIKLKELIDIDYKKLEKILEEAENDLEYRFSDEAFICLAIHIAISIKRLQENKDIKLSKEILEDLKKEEEFNIAQNMAKKLEEVFDVKLPESEIGYILLHILGSKLQQHKSMELNIEFSNNDSNDITVTMAKEIIIIAEKALSMKLSNDKQLLNGLILHLRPTINRVKYGLILRNPLLNEIKTNYPDIYGVAWMTSVVFEKYLGVKIEEEEIGYIALHIGAAVERNKKPLRALIVCHTGIGTSQLLSSRLKICFRQIDIIGSISSIGIKDKNLDNVDIIISTVPIEINKPVIVVKPLMTKNDIFKVENYLQNVFKDKSKYML